MGGETVNAYEYGLLQEQDNPAKSIKPTELSINKIDETKLKEIVKYISINLSCTQNCPLNSNCYEKCRVDACMDRFWRFFKTGE